jgi:hypothetical protein
MTRRQSSFFHGDGATATTEIEARRATPVVWGAEALRKEATGAPFAKLEELEEE